MANLKAHAAREFRKQMPVLWSGIGIAFLLWLTSVLGGRVLPQRNGSIALYISFPILWPILAAWSGALAFGGRSTWDLDKGPRLTSWVWNLAVAGLLIFLGLILTCIASLGISYENSSVLPQALRRWGAFLYSPDTHHQWDLSFLLGIPVSFITFGCAQLTSSLLNRSFVAGLAGTLGGMGISAAIIHCWLKMEMAPWMTWWPLTLELPWIVSISVISMIFMLASSFLIKTKHWGVNSSFFRLAVGIAFAACAATFGFMVLAFPRFIYITPRNAVLNPVDFYRNHILVEAFRKNSYTPRIMSVSMESGRIKSLAGRFSLQPIISLQGDWVAYLSFRNMLGLEGESVNLRAVRVDGTGDHILAPDLGSPPLYDSGARYSAVFSPDGRKVALTADNTLIVVGVDGKCLVGMPLPLNFDHYHQLGWRRDGSEVLVGPDSIFHSKNPLLACNPSTRRIRTLYESKQEQEYQYPSNSPHGIRFLLIGNQIFDVEKGVCEIFTRSKFRAAGISADQKTLIYGEEIANPPATRIHWRDIATGRDEVAQEFAGRLCILPSVSPAGDLAVVTQWDSAGKTFIIERTGQVRPFDSGRESIKWINDCEILILRGPSFHLSQAAILNAITMKMRIIYPYP